MTTIVGERGHSLPDQHAPAQGRVLSLEAAVPVFGPVLVALRPVGKAAVMPGQVRRQQFRDDLAFRQVSAGELS